MKQYVILDNPIHKKSILKCGYIARYDYDWFLNSNWEYLRLKLYVCEILNDWYEDRKIFDDPIIPDPLISAPLRRLLLAPSKHRYSLEFCKEMVHEFLADKKVERDCRIQVHYDILYSKQKNHVDCITYLMDQGFYLEREFESAIYNGVINNQVSGLRNLIKNYKVNVWSYLPTSMIGTIETRPEIRALFKEMGMSL